ncbi:MAG: hypothetical protein WC878_07115 [Candidatus Paceibacterota bacterium]
MNEFIFSPSLEIIKFIKYGNDDEPSSGLPYKCSGREYNSRPAKTSSYLMNFMDFIT